VSYDRNALRPLPGTLWAWEPRSEHSRALIEVTSVRWNGEEWFVGVRALLASTAFRVLARGVIWNDLERFWEACHYIASEPGPGSGLARSGAPQPDEMGEEAGDE